MHEKPATSNNMGLSYHSYPKIFALGHRATNQIFDNPVVVQEKIDGSQFSFGIFGGVLKCRSKNQQQYPETDKMFNLAIQTVEQLADYLIDGWTYRGEYLSKPKHNTLVYDRVPLLNIIIYDINDGLESYLTPEEVVAETKRLGLESVPTFMIGKLSPLTLEDLDKLLDTTSCLSGTKIEGVVIKNYHQFGVDKNVVMAKFVSEHFKEKHKVNWTPSSKKSVIEAIINGYRTEARWEKAFQHLQAGGELAGAPQDIGKLIIEAQADTLDECVDEIKDLLFNAFKKQISTGIIKGLPEWYKRKLVGGIEV